MNDDFSTRRRRLLRGAGAGGTALLAGCTDQLGLAQNESDGTDGDAENASDGTDGDGPDGQREVGVVLALDQQALQQAQAEIGGEVQAGNISEEEAQQQFRERQQELVGEAMESLTESLASSVTVVEEYAALGAVVIAGPPGALLDALDADAAQSLVLAGEVEAAASRAESGNTSEPSNESGSSDASGSTNSS